MSQKERQQNIANIPGKVDELDGESGDSARKDDIVSVTQSIEKLSLSGDKAGCATQSDDPTKLSKANPVLQALASWIQDGNCQRILVLTGAGVSVAAGIPDFRTPGTGLVCSCVILVKVLFACLDDVVLAEMKTKNESHIAVP